MLQVECRNECGKFCDERNKIWLSSSSNDALEKHFFLCELDDVALCGGSQTA
jgi:hypothetical protein